MSDFRMTKRTLRNYFSSSSGSGPSPSTPHNSSEQRAGNESTTQPKKPRVEFSQSNMIADPRNRKPIDD